MERDLAVMLACCIRSLSATTDLAEQERHTAKLADYFEAFDFSLTTRQQRKQPPPKPGKRDVTPALIERLQERAAAGLATYGTPLQTDNGRDALADALDEAMDLCQYVLQAILERDEAGR